MLLETNKDKGRAGLSMAIAYFGGNGYNVAIPLNDTQGYDLIIEKDNIFQRVECKTTSCKGTAQGSYTCSLRSTGGTEGKEYKRVNGYDADLLFCLTPDLVMFVIPIKDIEGKATIALVKERSKFANTNSFDSSKYIVTL